MKVMLRVRIAWWLRYLYLPGVYAYSRLMGLEPDWDKVGAMILRGIRVRAA